MTKRIIGMFLAICVMMSTLPTAAFAADEVSAKINGISVPAAGGSIVGEGISGSITFDVESKTLTLENAEISVTTETRAIDIRSGIDTLILKGKNEIKWADESDKTVSIYAISASVSSFLIKGNSRNDSLTVTLPGTKGGYRSAYAISTANCEIRNCSADITVIGGMQNFGDNVAIRVSDLKIKNAALDLIVGKDRQGNVQKAMQGGCVYATGRISIENSYIHAGIYSALGQGAAFYAALQGQGGTTCTDSVIYAESDVLQAGRTICLDGVDTTFSVKNSVLKAKSNQYAFSGYNYAKPTFESSLVELESKDIVMRGPTFGTISGFTKITATDKNGNVTTYNPGDDLSTLSADSRKVVIESPVHSHCVCGNDTDSGDHTSHSEEIWMPWSSTNTLPNDTGNYYLVNDVSVKSPWFAGWNNGEIKLCLNGKSLIFEKEYLLAHSFTLTDCIGGGGIYGENCNGIAVVSVRGNFNMYGGSIINKGESRFENVGVVTEWDWTSFNLYGGTVGNSSEGCAIWLSGSYGNTPLFNAYGGRVEGILYNPNFGKPVNFFDTEFMSLVRLPKFAKTVGTPNFGENGKYDYIYPIMLENDGVYTEVTDSNKDDVFGDGTVKYELAEEGETEKSVLTLDNAHIKASAGFGTIMPYGIDSEFESYNRDIDIVLIGENTVEETGGGYCISAFPGRTLTFRGDGKLNAVGKGVDLIGGIVDATHIVVESGDISVSSEKYGISSLDFTVNGGKIKIEGDKAAVWPSVYYTEDYGKITVNGGILELFAGENDGKLIDSDVENPTGEIIIKDNRWNKFLKGITFGLFFKETQNVTVIASDNSGGQVKIEYLLSQKELTEEELANAAFKNYAEFGIDPDNEYIVYVRLTDDAGNVSYICSEGIVLDGTVPIIGEIENGRTYCEAQTVTVEDKYIGSVDVNGKEIALDENGRFVLEPSQGEQKITVTDKAGNVSEVTVTVNFGHTPLDDDGDCTTPVMCEFCGKEAIAAKSHDFKGDYVVTKSGHGKKCTNGGCSVSEEEKPHFAEPDGDCTTDDICECGYFVTEAKASHDFGKWVSTGDGTHTRRCLSEGCTAGVETEGCFGGRANCVEKAVCEGCAASYGQIDEKNHENAEHILAANPTTQSEGNIEYWRCKDCGKYFSDASLTKEIFLSDTVLKRLEPEQAPPKTGESKAIFPALCLLCTAAFVIIKKSNKQK